MLWFTGFWLEKIVGWASSRNSGKHGLSLLRSSGDSIRRFDENARTCVVSMFGKVQSLHSDRTLARARSLCSDRAKRVLGRYVATELRLELGRYVATSLAQAQREDTRRYRSRPSFELDARSLCSDRAWLGLGLLVATPQTRRSSLGSGSVAYVAAERDGGRSRPLSSEPNLDRGSVAIRPGATDAGCYVSDPSETDALVATYCAPSLAGLQLLRLATPSERTSVATCGPSLARGRSLRSDRAWLELGRYVATELCACLVAAYRSSLACPRSDFHTRACPRPIWIHVRCLRTIGI
ncbi:hypothetical protein IGI04_043123 [Brassica rapa subsp. trilocularis]|uniref:Uncharacterized protein n=1 Tax=Brassica rapa subsp. trilocularis TaxID=1813537 RepID=A0ABQ7KK34_BRACM|nr:hypothetical protein IGI04_043123 [Brassica rapa subsp. trilocularis]